MKREVLGYGMVTARKKDVFAKVWRVLWQIDRTKNKAARASTSGKTFVGSFGGAKACPAAQTASRSASSRKNRFAALQSPSLFTNPTVTWAAKVKKVCRLNLPP